MTVQDHRYHRPAPGADFQERLQGRLSPFWRWLTELVWRLEHGFERARADARPEEDTRVRIFLILIVFSCVFAGLALGASYRALLAPADARGFGASPDALVRGDLTDRNGELLAINIVHYGLYIDPAEIWDRGLAYRQLRRALPRHHAAGAADKAVLIDGSVLVNAPFRPAIDALGRRPARRQVDRRFVYIDPFPGMHFRLPGGGGHPGFFQTIIGAISAMPPGDMLTTWQGNSRRSGSI